MPPKRHHYLPQFFLERFCTDGLLWVFDRDEDTYRRQQPLNTAVRKDYYTFKEGDGSKSVEIELLLSRIESGARSALDRLDRGETPSGEDRQHIALFVGFLAARVPEFASTVSEIVDHTMKWTMDIMFPSLEATDARMDQFERDRPRATPIDRERFFEFVQGKEYTVEPHRNLVLGTMLKVAIEQADLFAQMNWLVLRAPTKKSFVLSDNPLIVLPSRKPPAAWMGTGILTPGATKLVPLSTSSCLLMGDRGDAFGFVDATEPRVREANLVLTERADRFVFARDERQLRSLIKASGLLAKTRGPRIAFS